MFLFRWLVEEGFLDLGFPLFVNCVSDEIQSAKRTTSAKKTDRSPSSVVSASPSSREDENCGICYESVSAASSVLFTCKHRLCGDCWAQMRVFPLLLAKAKKSKEKIVADSVSALGAAQKARAELPKENDSFVFSPNEGAAVLEKIVQDNCGGELGHVALPALLEQVKAAFDDQRSATSIGAADTRARLENVAATTEFRQAPVVCAQQLARRFLGPQWFYCQGDHDPDLDDDRDIPQPCPYCRRKNLKPELRRAFAMRLANGVCRSETEKLRRPDAPHVDLWGEVVPETSTFLENR